MTFSIASSLRALGILFFGLVLLSPVQCSNGIKLIDFFGKGLYLPGERPILSCDYGNLSSTEGSASFFHNGQKLTDDEDHFIYPSCTQSCSSDSLALLNFADQLSGNYSCGITSNGQVITSNIISIGSAKYSILITKNSSLRIGMDIQLSCMLDSESERPDTIYVWTLQHSDFRVFSQLLNLANVTANDSGLYICEIDTGVTAMGLTAEVFVEVVDQPPLFNNTESTVEAMLDKVAELECLPETMGPTNYSWFRYGHLVTNTSEVTIDPSGNTLTISHSQYSDAGIYICQATNLFSYSNKSWNLIVKGLAIFSVSDSEFQLLEGASVTLPCDHIAVPEANVTWTHHLLDQDESQSKEIVLNDMFSLGPANELVIGEVEFDDSGYYICTASNVYGDTAIQYMLTVIGKPVSPMGLSVAGSALSNSVEITWSPYTSPERRLADKFVVELSDNGGSTYMETMNINTTTVTEALVVNLIPDVAYTMRLVAVNKAGRSGPSNVIEFQTAVGAPKLGPVVVTPIEGGRSLLIEWTIEYTGGSTITELYAVVTSQDGNTQRFDLDVESTSQMISGLEPSTEYTVSLSIANAIGEASYLQPQPILTTRGPPGIPAKPVILSSGSRSATLQVNITSLGSEPIAYFLVDVVENEVYMQRLNLSVDSDSVELDMTTSTGTAGHIFELVVMDLSTTHVYSFSVAAGGQLGHGEFSEYSDDIAIGTTEFLYSIISAVVGSAVIIVAVIVSIVICAACAKRRSKMRQITISATHSPNVIVLPNSPLSKQHMYDDIGTVDGPVHTFSTIPHHKRTHSASSTTSSHTSGVPMKSHTATHMNGGQAIVTKNPVAAVNSYTGLLTDKPAMFRPSYAQKGWFSSPIINRMSYDVDSLAPKLSYATDV